MSETGEDSSGAGVGDRGDEVRTGGATVDEAWPTFVALSHRGRTLDAIAAVGGREALPRHLAEARSPRDRVRLARVLRAGGSGRAAHLIIRHLARRAPEDPWTRAEWLPQQADGHPLAAFLQEERRVKDQGLASGWTSSEANVPPAGLDEDWSVLWFFGRLELLNTFRLFDESRRVVDDAEARFPHHPWARCLRPQWLAAQDRRQEALDVIQGILDAEPTIPFAHMLRVRFLSLLGRREEAVDAARAGLRVVEDAGLARQAASMLVEIGRRSEAIDLLDEAERLSPLADRSLRQYLRSSRLECLYLDERFDEALAVAEAIVRDQHRRASRPERRSYAERIRDALSDPARAERRRIVLPVPFVPQDHMTCSPATLAAIAGTWREATGQDGEPTPHAHTRMAERIAAEICTDGTPVELSRDWADRNGWRTAEFLPDAASTEALIARGLPFAIHTAWLGGGHSQTLMGFDARTGTAVVREPSIPRFIERTFERKDRIYPGFALVGLAMVPADAPEAAALDEVALPARGPFDLQHQMRLGWRLGDEVRADRAFDELRERWPDDDATLLAIADRAARHGNAVVQLEAITVLAERYPEDDLLVRRRASLLQSLGRLDEALALLTARIGSRAAAPGLLLDAADVRLNRGEPAASVERIVLTAAARGHSLSECCAFLAMLRQRHGDLEGAVRLLWANGYLAPSHRGSMDFWLDALRRLGRLPEAIAELERRLTAEQSLAKDLLRALASALWMAGRREEACERIERAAASDPDDQTFGLLRVRYRRALGRHRDADDALASLEGRISQLDLLSERATGAMARHDRVEAMGHYRAILAIDPTSAHAWSGLHDLASDPTAVDGLVDELLAHFERMPAYWTVVDALTVVLRDRDPGRGIAVLRRHLEHHPSNATAWQRLALLESAVGHAEEAVTAARRACEIAPTHGESWSTLADALDARLAASAPGEPQASRPREEIALREESRAAALRAIEMGQIDMVSIDRVTRTFATAEERAEWLRERWRSALAPPRSAELLHALAASSSPPLPIDETLRCIADCDRGPEFEAVHGMGAVLLGRENRHDEAVRWTDEMAASYGHSERFRSFRLRTLLDAKRFADAIREAERWSADAPNAVEPLRFLVSAYSAQQDATTLEATLRRLLALTPNDIAVSGMLAFRLRFEERLTEARMILDDAWERSQHPKIGWERLDLCAEAGYEQSYASCVADLLPTLHHPREAIEALHARLPGKQWMRKIWLEAVESVDDASPAGVKAIWGLLTIAHDTPRWTVGEMQRRFARQDSHDAVLVALAFFGVFGAYADLTAFLVREQADAVRRSASTLLTVADGLWIAGRRTAIPGWLAGWQERNDLIADDLKTLGRILDATGDHAGALAAATRGLALAAGEEYSGLLLLRGVALLAVGEPDEAAQHFHGVRERPADTESEALAAWALMAFRALADARERGGPPRHADLTDLNRDAAKLLEHHPSPITNDLLDRMAKLLRAQGAPRGAVQFDRGWWARFSDRYDDAHRRTIKSSAHACFTLFAPIGRTLRHRFGARWGLALGLGRSRYSC